MVPDLEAYGEFALKALLRMPASRTPARASPWEF
jgi:hypothetical protein